MEQSNVTQEQVEVLSELIEQTTQVGQAISELGFYERLDQIGAHPYAAILGLMQHAVLIAGSKLESNAPMTDEERIDTAITDALKVVKPGILASLSVLKKASIGDMQEDEVPADA